MKHNISPNKGQVFYARKCKDTQKKIDRAKKRTKKDVGYRADVKHWTSVLNFYTMRLAYWSSL